MYRKTCSSTSPYHIQHGILKPQHYSLFKAKFVKRLKNCLSEK